MDTFVITDGKRFIMCNQNNQYVPTSDIMKAEIFTKKQVDGVYNNSLPKPLRAIFHIEQKHNTDLLTPKPIVAEKVTENETVISWLNRIQGLQNLRNDAKERKEKLESMLKSVDDELLDIEHWIEFSNFNASQGCRASKELKRCRIKRREIKNELLVLEIILQQDLNEGVFDAVQKRVNGMDKRAYTPRIRRDLFEI